MTCEGERVPDGGSAGAVRAANASLSRAVRRSATPRELTNTMVDERCSTWSRIASSTCGQMLPPRAWVESGSSCSSPGVTGRADGSWVRSSTGITTDSSSRLGESGATMRTGRVPPRNRAISSCGRTVALSPMRRAGAASRASRRSSDTARWLPRLVPATAWTSSTMTVSTCRSVSRAAEVSIRNSDSGVVIKMSGGRCTSARRSRWLVSPDLTPTVTSWKVSPRRAAVWVMPTRGDRRLRSTSTARALSGEMYRTREPTRASSSAG